MINMKNFILGLVGASLLIAGFFPFFVPPAPESIESTYKVLHYTETTGYNHNTKSQSLAMFNSWANDYNYTVTNDDNGSEFNSLTNLQQYNVVVFSNTSGKNGLNATQRANFEAYIAGGGSYLGIHAASDTYRHSSANGNSTGAWDWYAENVTGVSVQENPNHTSSSHNNTMLQQAPGHPILAFVPGQWNKTEEYYYWENGYQSTDTAWKELLRVGQTGSKSYDAPRMMAQYKNIPGGGRAFYTALGHDKINYQVPPSMSSSLDPWVFQQLIKEALLWTMDWQAPVAFGIFFTEEKKTETPEIYDGHFVVDQPFIPGYTVSDMNGRVVFQGDVVDGKVKIFQRDGTWLYKTGSKYWIYGTRL